MAILIVIAVFILLMGSGVAIAYASGAAAVVAFFASDSAFYLAVAPQRIFSQMDVFAIMAMPLFIWAGDLMGRGGVARALIDLSMLLVGRFRGGLGHANVVTAVFFSGISGSAAADAAALSNTFVPQMQRRGYDPLYAGALTAAASVIGPIIPPSIVFILYGAILSTDIAALFAAGIVPGILIAAVLMIMNAWMARREGHPGGTPADMPPVLPTLKKALPSLVLPAVILGGIVFGVMTPIEAGAVAVVAAVAVGFIESTVSSIVMTGALFMLLAAGALGNYLIALHQVADVLNGWVQSFHLQGLGYLIFMTAIFLVMGMFIDLIVALTLFAPLLVPVAIAQGADPVALGVMVCLNLTLGIITPPFGGAIMLVSTITRQSYWAMCRRILPFVFAEIVVLLLVVLFPEISLALPRWLGML